MPRTVLLSTASLAALGAVLGFVLGRNVQQMDESTVISAVAQRYVQDTGGEALDCIGVPGQQGIWVKVVCGSRTYHVDRAGRITQVQGPDA